MTPTPSGRQLLDVFDHIYVINLAHRRDRLKEVRFQLGRLGLDLGSGPVARFDACRFEETEGFPTTGARGCFHSHLAILHDALSAGYGSILILEDDLDFTPDIEARLPKALHALRPVDWSIFYGATLNADESVEAAGPIEEASPGAGMMGTHFIGLRSNAIRQLVPYLEAMAIRTPGSPLGGPMHVDGAYSWFRRQHPHIHTCIAIPDLGTQRSSRTDVHVPGWKDRLPIFKQLTSLGRILLKFFKKNV